MRDTGNSSNQWVDSQFNTPNVKEWAKEYLNNPYGEARKGKPDGKTWSEYYSEKAKQDNSNLTR